MATPATAEGAKPEGQAQLEAEVEKDTSAPMTLEEIEACSLPEIAKDKYKSRLLQRSLVRGGPEIADLIFKKAEPCFMELVHDQYGNYLSQKVLEAASAEHFDKLFALLKGHLRDLAQDVHGTRAVQKVVEQAISRGKVAELLEVLPGEFVEQLSRSVTGFHVIVKLLEALPMKEAEEITERLCNSSEKALSLGTDQWGCCVLKKCVDRAEGPGRQRIMDAITDNTLTLVQDPFGNYVIQHLVQSGPGSSITKIIDSLRGRMFDFALQKFSSNVLEKCLTNSSDKDRNKIINEILNPPTCLPSEAVRQLLFHQYGNYVFQQALEVAKDPQFSLLVEHAKQHVQDIARAQTQGSEIHSAAGSLASEHARRLAMKLVKKYPQLSDGLDIETSPMGAGADANAWGSGYYDPYAAAYGGYDAYGAAWSNPMQMPASPVYGYPFPPAWDPSYAGAYPPFGFLPSKGAGHKGGRGGHRPRSQQGRRGAGQKGKGRGSKDSQALGSGKGGVGPAAGQEAATPSSTPGGAGNQTVRVGRIVGFWPNYTVTYDEVPVAPTAASPSAGGGGRGGGKASRSKAKGKASPRKSAAPAASQASSPTPEVPAVPAAAG